MKKDKTVIVTLTGELVDVPSEIQLFPYGEVQTCDGPFLVDEIAMGEMIKAFGEQGNDLVFDYEHQTLSGKEAPAAGWIKQLINKGKEGLWAVIDWTERAKTYLSNKEYRYFSPVGLRRLSDNRLVRLHSIALTNTPKTYQMEPLVNKQLPGQEDQGGITKEVNIMPLEKLIALLGLAAGATEEDVVAAIEKLMKESSSGSEVVAAKEVLDALGLQGTANKSEIVGTILALKQPGNLVSMQEFQALKKSVADRDRNDLVTLAFSQGKIAPAQKEWAEGYAGRDPEGFKVFIAKAPVVVPIGGDGGENRQAGGNKGMDDTQLMINKQLGISDEKFKKFSTVTG